ncbi:ABC transporter permease [Erysipelotrichaceae bacterium OttesenSCG-928-M19]|nr:ABC transporter permease [Erysipelotrichaceae bacterium OttesenSCG-928-M19]
MIVFKTYYKVIFRNKMQIFINLFICLFISIFFATSNNEANSFDRSNFKNINVGYVYKDKSIKNTGLVEYLEQTFTLKEISDDDIKINDALFYRSVDYVILINADSYESYQVPNSSAGYIVKNYLNNYLNTYHSYETAKIGGDSKIATLTLKNLKTTTKVINYQSDDNIKIKNMGKFFNMYVYSLLGCVIVAISLVMVTFNNNHVFERTIVSSMNVRKRNLLIYLGHALFGIFTWLLMSIASVVYFKEQSLSIQHLMLLINSFIFVFPVTALAFMISQLIKRYTIIGAVNNVVTLGMSFISGAFIPQALLGGIVIKIASFTPAYWFVLNNDRIIELSSFDFSNLFQPILIQIAFGIAFIAIGLAFAKLKNTTTLK